MNTGIKALDELLLNHDLNFPVGESNFLLVDVINNVGDLKSINLPPCIHIAAANHVKNEIPTKLVRFYLPYKSNQKFATLLLNEDNIIIEKVCYQKNTRYKQAFSKLIGQIKQFSTTLKQ
mgnify:CR=1 FL=1